MTLQPCISVPDFKLTLLLLVLFFAACKKENPAPVQPNYNVGGTWALYSFKNGYPTDSSYYNATQYPCLESNILAVNGNGTTRAYYTGASTCILASPSNQQFGISVGILGEDTIKGEWTTKGSIFQLKALYSDGEIGYEYGKITSINGKLQIAFMDTLGITNPPSIETQVFLKQ